MEGYIWDGCVCEDVCVYVCMYVCVYVCMCVCMCVYVCMYVCMYVVVMVDLSDCVCVCWESLHHWSKLLRQYLCNGCYNQWTLFT